jgi:hypothetical protein
LRLHNQRCANRRVQTDGLSDHRHNDRQGFMILGNNKQRLAGRRNGRPTRPMPKAVDQDLGERQQEPWMCLKQLFES